MQPCTRQPEVAGQQHGCRRRKENKFWGFVLCFFLLSDLYLQQKIEKGNKWNSVQNTQRGEGGSKPAYKEHNLAGAKEGEVLYKTTAYRYRKCIKRDSPPQHLETKNTKVDIIPFLGLERLRTPENRTRVSCRGSLARTAASSHVAIENKLKQWKGISKAPAEQNLQKPRGPPSPNCCSECC